MRRSVACWVLVGVALALWGTAAQADTVVVNDLENNWFQFVVKACPIGRAAGDLRNITDFHIFLGGTLKLVAGGAPAGWSGGIVDPKEGSWKTNTHPIIFNNPRSQKVFKVKITGRGKLVWRTTGKRDALHPSGKIAEGTINPFP